MTRKFEDSKVLNRKRLSCSWCRISNRVAYVMDPGKYRHWLCRGDLLEESVLLAQWRAYRVVTEGSCFDSFDLLLWTHGNSFDYACNAVSESLDSASSLSPSPKHS